MFDRLIEKQTDPTGGGTYTSAQSFAYSGNNVILVYNGSGTLTDRLLVTPPLSKGGPGGVGSTGDGGNGSTLADENGSGTVSWLLADNQGTVRDVAQYNSGMNTTTVVDHLEYNSFGVITAQSNSAYQPLFAYTGQMWDAAIGLYYNHARWYDASTGRFISQDPTRFAAGDANLYRYVQNSPPNFIDPTGMIGAAANGAGAISMQQQMNASMNAQMADTMRRAQGASAAAGTMLVSGEAGSGGAGYSGNDWLDAYANMYNGTAAGLEMTKFIQPYVNAAAAKLMSEAHLAHASAWELAGITTGITSVAVVGAYYIMPALIEASYAAGTAGVTSVSSGAGLFMMTESGAYVLASAGVVGLTAGYAWYNTGKPTAGLNAAGQMAMMMFMNNPGIVLGPLSNIAAKAWMRVRGTTPTGAPMLGPLDGTTPPSGACGAGGPCFVAGTPVMVGGPAFDAVIVSAGTLHRNPRDEHPTFLVAAVGMAVVLGICELPTKRRPSKRRRLLDDVFGDDMLDYQERDGEESANCDAPPQPDKMRLKTTMKRGYVFPFTNRANDPFAAPNIEHSPTGVVAARCHSPELSASGRSGSAAFVVQQATARSQKATNTGGRPRSGRSIARTWRSARVALGLALVLGCLVRGLWFGGSAPVESAPAAKSVAAAMPLRAIEEVHVGDRVITDLPSRMSSDTAVDPETWRLLRLTGEARHEDGTFFGTINVEALLPVLWTEEHHASVGSQVPFPLELVEMGLNERALGRVTAIEPCPSVQPGAGRVVLTTVSSSPSNAVLELSLRHADARTEAIRPTAFHRFFSEDRNEWLCARDLRDGEKLRGIDGPITVVSGRRLAGVHRVYNMTVEADHQFHVSSLGVLSHNTGEGVGSCPTAGEPPMTWPKTAQEMEEFLGMPGTAIPDTPGTPGRGKWIFQPCANIKITFEQHPYHPNAPDWHKGPHWHIDMPGEVHGRHLPGEPIQ